MESPVPQHQPCASLVDCDPIATTDEAAWETNGVNYIPATLLAANEALILVVLNFCALHPLVFDKRVLKWLLADHIWPICILHWVDVPFQEWLFVISVRLIYINFDNYFEELQVSFSGLPFEPLAESLLFDQD